MSLFKNTTCCQLDLFKANDVPAHGDFFVFGEMIPALGQSQTWTWLRSSEECPVPKQKIRNIFFENYVIDLSDI